MRIRCCGWNAWCWICPQPLQHPLVFLSNRPALWTSWTEAGLKHSNSNLPPVCSLRARVVLALTDINMRTLSGIGCGKPPAMPSTSHGFPLRGGPHTDLCHGAWLSHTGPQRVQHWSSVLDRTGAQKISALLAMPGSVQAQDYAATIDGTKVPVHSCSLMLAYARSCSLMLALAARPQLTEVGAGTSAPRLSARRGGEFVCAHLSTACPPAPVWPRRASLRACCSPAWR